MSGRPGGQADEPGLLQGLSAGADGARAPRRDRRHARADARRAGPRRRPRPLFLGAGAAALRCVFTVYPVLRTFYNSVHYDRAAERRTSSSASGNFSDVLTADPCSGRRSRNTAIFTVVGTVADVARRPAARPVPVRQRAARALPAGRLVHAGPDVLRRRRHHLGVDLRLRLGAGEPASCGWLGLGALEQSWLGRSRRPRSGRCWSTHLWKWLGFNMIVCLAALHALPGEVLGAAELDNCGWFAKLVYIIVPMLRPTAGQSARAVLHRQDDDVRPGLDHDRRRAAVVDRDRLDLRLQAGLRLEHLRPRLSVGDRRPVVRRSILAFVAADDARCCASASGWSSDAARRRLWLDHRAAHAARSCSLIALHGRDRRAVPVGRRRCRCGRRRDLRRTLTRLPSPPHWEQVRRRLDQVELRHLFLEQPDRRRRRRRCS